MVAVGNVVAADFILQTGIDIPISRFKNPEAERVAFVESSGIEFGLKANAVFDNNLFIGLNFGVGSTKIKDFWPVDKYLGSQWLYSTHEDAKGYKFNIEVIPIGYAIPFSENVKLMIGPIVGFTMMGYDSVKDGVYDDGTKLRVTCLYFTPGAEVILSARFGSCFGMFAGLKGTALIGRTIVSENDMYFNGKVTNPSRGFEITPTVGLQLTF